MNKFFAHAATPESRGTFTGKTDLSLAGLIDLVVEAAQLVNSISALLVSTVFDFLATAQYDKWEYWGRGWDISSDVLEATWRKWHRRVERLQPLYPTTAC